MAYSTHDDLPGPVQQAGHRVLRTAVVRRHEGLAMRRFWRRTARMYRITAVLLLNTLIVVCALELLSTAVIKIAHSSVVKNLLAEFTGTPNDLVEHHYLGLSYYAERSSWAARYWREHKLALRKTYHPYVIWRSAAFAGETLNIDEDGVRVTPGARCAPEAYTVYTFGGSGMWGWGAPDWGTIPAYLQAELQQRRGGPVCVVNFGEQAYVSTQSLIQLELLLESGRVPNVVVFYDGVNEVLAASQNARPFFHQNYEEVAKLFQSPRHPLTTWLGQSSSVYLMRQARSQFGGSSRPHVAFDPDRVADDVAAAYLANLKTVRALAQAYGFEVHFFWQPYILLGDKPLSPEERQMQSGLSWVLNLDQPLRRLFTVTHERIEARAETVDDLHDLVHAFDDVPDPIWIDTWGHITPDGNRLVAQSILRTIESRPRS